MGRCLRPCRLWRWDELTDGRLSVGSIIEQKHSRTQTTLLRRHISLCWFCFARMTAGCDTLLPGPGICGEAELSLFVAYFTDQRSSENVVSASLARTECHVSITR